MYSLKIRLLVFSSLALLHSNNLISKENILLQNSIQEEAKKLIISGCSPAMSMVDLDINNVRTKIIAGGDMWWDLANARYEIPNGSGKHSLYAGSLWIGGFDAASQLKVAAQTYRQTGNDYYPGPLYLSGGTDASTCSQFDRLWKLNKADVEAYHTWIVNGAIGPSPVSGNVMQSILDWPSVTPEGQSLAPYFDYNGNGIYDPSYGDYPKFNLSNSNLCTNNQLYGDQVIWWVFNDIGNSHSSSGGAAIGLEIQAQAFAFSTSDPINDMTFYKYKIINKSSYALNNTYFGQWVDPDLGTYSDDYVGCDVERGMGYCYNGSLNDGIYGANPPAIGVDFLQGPYADPDGLDNASSTALRFPLQITVMA